MTFIDTNLVKEKFNRGLTTYDASASVQKTIVNRFVAELKKFSDLNNARLLEVGCGTGFLTKRLMEIYKPNLFIANDISTTSQDIIARLNKDLQTNINFLEGNAEQINFPNHLDAVLSCSTIQWFEDIQSFFNKVYNSLSQEGILGFSTFGVENFKEIKYLTGVGLDYKRKDEIFELLKHKFEILYRSEWMEKKRFDTPIDVLRHMKNTGVNGITKQAFGKRQMNNFTETYSRNFKIEGKVELTYNPIIIIAKKKNEI